MARLTITSLILLAAVASAHAQAPCRDSCRRGLLESMVDDFHQNNRWPYPYVCPDRQAVQEPFAVMNQSGWRRQNLLADHHFRDKSDQLNEAGQTLIRRIVHETVPQHRTIYVRRTESADATAARVKTAEQFAAKIAADGSPPPVLETNAIPAGYPAGWPPVREGSVSRRFQVSVPKEMYLPETDKDSGGGGK